MQVIVGTAGHIDHGKTALVKALTGTDTDRLPEEKRRGITVDLGFAAMTSGDIHFGFVDVPGHERFVKNMLAGASGVDMVLLVVAADEGVMPQTREHFEICRLLGISHGIVALTKLDLVDSETEDLARMDVVELVTGSFLENAPVVAVSSRTGEGVGKLMEGLVNIATAVSREDDFIVTRLPIDRSFSVRGFGSVVTGTLASGTLAEGQELEVLPAEKKVRVRGLQTHGSQVAEAVAGQRVAVNLGGIDHSQVTRGMVLVEPDVLRPAQIIDAWLEVLPGSSRKVRDRQRLRFHVGTVEVLGRVQVLNSAGEIKPGSSDLIQLRLEDPVTVVPGERFIIRSYSPQATIAGGEIIDPAAQKHRGKDMAAVRDFLSRSRFARRDVLQTVELLVEASGMRGISLSELQSRTAMRIDLLAASASRAVDKGTIVDTGEVFITNSSFVALQAKLLTQLEKFHREDALAKGMGREAARDQVLAHSPADIFASVVDSLAAGGRISVERDLISLSSHRAEMSSAEASALDTILGRFKNAALEVPKLDEVLAVAAASTGLSVQHARRLLQTLVDSGDIVKVSEDFYFSGGVIDSLVVDLRHHAAISGERLIDVRGFKRIAGVSRKYAIPLLEYLDRKHITARAGDKRVIL